MERQSDVQSNSSRIIGWLHTLKTWKKVLLIFPLCAILICIAFIALYPLREIVINAVERFVVHKTLIHAHWHEWLIVHMLLAIVFLSLIAVLMANSDSAMRSLVCRMRFLCSFLWRHREQWVPYVLSLFAFMVIILRSACSAIVNDEAYTYMEYSLPIADGSFILDGLHSFLHSNANNHLLNTFLISIVARLTNVRYNEFVIRIPILIFALVYHIAIARCLEKKAINLAEFSLLCFSYYINEHLSIARGYGMSMCLVFAGLIYFKKYLVTSSFKPLWRSVYLLILSAYANTVSLLVIFAVGVLAIADLVKRRRLLAFIQQGAFRLALCISLLIIVLCFHLEATDMTALFSIDKVTFVHYTKQYLCFITNSKSFASVVLWILSIVFCAAFIYSAAVTRGKHCELSSALMIHTALMFVLPIFGRGTLTERLLIPSYPLVVIGGGEILTNCCNGIKPKAILFSRIVKAIKVLVLVAMLCNFVHNIDLMHTVYNFGDGNVRVRYRHGERSPNEEGVWHTCVWEFYENQDKYMEHIDCR